MGSRKDIPLYGTYEPTITAVGHREAATQALQAGFMAW